MLITLRYLVGELATLKRLHRKTGGARKRGFLTGTRVDPFQRSFACEGAIDGVMSGWGKMGGRKCLVNYPGNNECIVDV